MKKLIKAIVLPILSLMAREVVRRYKPKVVMVTGSVGKTSTKDAVAAALCSALYVRKSKKSFNSEFGVPFTILDVDTPWRSLLPWFTVFKRAVALLLLPNHYPNMLVLEVGADKPGDMAHILSIVRPDVVVVTRLPDIPVHVEAYASPEELRDEEFSPAYALAVGAPLIVSADDPHALELAKRVPARLITYGTAEGASVRLADMGFLCEGEEVRGMRALAHLSTEKYEIAARGSVGKTHIYPLGAALAAAVAFDIPMAEAVSALKDYQPPPGRGTLLRGLNNSLLIDDSYNASPVALEEALETLRAFPLPTGRQGRGRRIAVLGDMLELGRYSSAEHERIGKLARETADLVFAVGIRARGFLDPGCPTLCPTLGVGHPGSHTAHFENSRAAAEALKKTVREGDVVLIKGSQSVRMERVVEALLADANDRSRLVRQERQWKQT